MLKMRPTIPANLPKEIQVDGGLLTLVGKANAALSEYKGRLLTLPNPNILLAPLVSKEAVFSSKIEGTRTELNELLENLDQNIEEDESSQWLEDLKEVRNYDITLTISSELIEQGHPLSQHLIRQCHQNLMRSVRGKDKKPGHYRKIQNFIGHNHHIEDARYVPPTPETMESAMNNLEEYLKYEDIDPLIQTAIVHAQFEIIHPFLDGNGRVGRMLIPLFLYWKKYLNYPAFYISEYLEKNRAEYYDRLLAITSQDDWYRWITFFLEGVIEQANKNQMIIEEIIELYNDIKMKVPEITASRYAIQIVDYLFSRPIFTIPQLAKKIDSGPGTITKSIRKLHESNILELFRQGKGQKASGWAFKPLLEIIHK
ncbi:MAG: Fic family protein [Deltaproteobacteria bacterium]|nr:Fic family protein [Deltaproteobacteria bacterium]